MKPFAVFLIFLCIAAVVAVGYLYMTTELAVTGTACTALDAADQPDTFQALKTAVGSDFFTGTAFQTADWKEASEYQFYTYTLRLKNDTFLRAEAIELQIAPMEGDLLFYGDLTRHDLAPRTGGDFQVTLLTSKQAHNIREITVTWYFWGLPFSEKITYSR